MVSELILYTEIDSVERAGSSTLLLWGSSKTILLRSLGWNRREAYIVYSPKFTQWEFQTSKGFCAAGERPTNLAGQLKGPPIYQAYGKYFVLSMGMRRRLLSMYCIINTKQYILTYTVLHCILILFVKHIKI